MVFRKADNENFDSTNIVLFLYKWRKPLVVVTLLAIVASVIFSSPMFITPKYKSTVILYPVATNAISKALLTESGGVKEDILDFGEDEETEQLLQILHSNRIRDRIIERYDLMEHYNIDAASGYKLTRLYREYEENITFRRTEFMAVKITVLDKDPQMAAAIANDIADLLDSTKNEMQKKRAQRAYEIVKEQYFKLRHEVQAMEDSLSMLRALGVHDYESQAEMINQQLAIELANGNQAAVRRLENKLEILARYGGPYVSLRDALEHEKKQLSMLRAKYEEAKTDAEEVLPTKFVVNSAYEAERKSYPIRWLIVVVTTVSALLLTLVLILMFENLGEYLPARFRAMVAERNNIHKKKYPPEGKDPPVPPREPPQPYHSSTNITQKPVDNPPPKPASEKKPNQNTDSNKSKIQNQHTETETQSNAVKIEKRDNQMERYFTNTNILKLLFKWKIHLAVVLIIGIVLAVIFSSPLFITPKFKSHAVVYPSNIQPYSEESESEQMLQFFESKEISDRIIRKYDLASRYKIDSSYKYFKSAIEYEYSQNVSISKTPYESVKIEVFDADPLVASNMVKDIIYFYNEKVRETHLEKFNEVVVFFEDRLQRKQQEIDSVENKLYELRTVYGIIDYPNQSREVARGFLRTVDGNNAAQNINTREVLKLKENIEQKGGLYTMYNDRYFDLIAEFGKIKMLYDDAVMNASKNISYASVISEPYPADKKAYPVRWVIVVLTAIGILFFSLLAVLIIENYESIKRNF
ncbi:MAG: hypothetical protein ACLFPE_00675 [Bacteroidales bacterium]